MNNYDQVPYQFEVRENISFRRGEEIDDLYSIAIDPDVNVIHENSFVQVRGVLVVRGDYQTNEQNLQSHYIVDEDEQNTVQQVRALDNGFMEFQYPIPIDITIPKNRLRTDDDIQVVIDYFDYELPEPNTLKIYSNVRLDGTVALDEATRADENDLTQSDFELKEFPTMQEDSFDSNYDDGNEVTEASSFNEESAYQTEETNDYDGDHDGENEKGRELWKKQQKTQSIQEFFKKKDPYEGQTEEVAQDTNDPTGVYPEQSDAESEHDEYENYDEDYDDLDPTDYDEDHDADDHYDSEDEEKKPKKGISYLSKFFREESSGKVKVRMRFVQENETLQSIANNYDVSVAKLERINGIQAGDELNEGDVIYVPAEAKQPLD
ncbi:LysM peptidoglycan-binding domain-containing protein [Alkalibacillus aidingensis]|uniref:LysM peptidoglycan-binding domain-containing protein n=1 Tax=Alkalibacillus aidingensis TaxID=2747607 RepID=UPI001661404C|nr:LysM peptidoglycan-binding domain-containing protein [Alkalibacillus aidingensis]